MLQMLLRGFRGGQFKTSVGVASCFPQSWGNTNREDAATPYSQDFLRLQNGKIDLRGITDK